MGKNRSASGLINVINYDNFGNISFVSGSTTLMSVSSSGAITTTGVISGSSVQSASLAQNSNLLQGTGSVGFTTTASFTATSGSASSRLTQIEAVYATTGSNSFRATQSITGSLTVTGQIIAQTINVQQVTSSIVYSSGSNVFGCDINSRQTFTGSFYQTGSVSAFYSCVGIGTNFPTKALEIFSNVSQDGIKISGASNPRLTIIDTTNSVQFDALTTDTEAVLRTDTNHPLHLSTNGTLRLNINNTGIACFSCQVCVPRLQVFNTNSIIVVEGTATNGEGTVTIAGKNSSGTSRSAIFKYDNADIIRISTADAIPMRFETSDVTRLTIASTGIACFACQVCVPSLRATSVDISAGSSAAFSFGVDHQSTFAFGGLNGKRVAIIRDGTCADNGLQFGYDVVDKTGVIAGSATAAGVGIDFYTYNGSAWGNRMRLTKDGITCFSNTICTPKIGYNGYNGATGYDLLGHFDAGSTNIATLSGENSYTRVVAHIEWVSNYALAGTNMTMGYTIVDTRRGNSNTIWVNCACTILAYGDSPANPTFGWSNGVLSVSVPGSTGLTARFRISSYAATVTPNI